MTFYLGPTSKERLLTCCDDIQNSVRLYMEWGIMDCTIVEGHRGRAAQDRYYKLGKSRVRYPEGLHNLEPSRAIDIAPYINGAISWEKLPCIHLAGGLIAAARCLGVNLRWGGNWDSDGEIITDQTFQDLVHFEVKA